MSEDAIDRAQQPSLTAGNYDPDTPGKFVPEALDRTIIAVPLRREIRRDPLKVHRVIIDFDWDVQRDEAFNHLVTLIELAKTTSSTPAANELNVVRSAGSQQYAFARLQGVVIQELVRLDRYDADEPEEGHLPSLAEDDIEAMKVTVAAQLAKARIFPDIGDAWHPRSSTGGRIIHSIWPDFPVRALLTKSTSTIKADAARAAFSAFGEKITWAVVDSGIDAAHPHFLLHQNLVLDDGLEEAHRAFTFEGDDPLKDAFGHGTHVAGIIAGEVIRPANGADGNGAAEPIAAPTATVASAMVSPSGAGRATESALGSTALTAARDTTRQIIAVTREVDERRRVKRVQTPLEKIAGIAPRTKLVSIKVLDENGEGEVSSLILALEHIQQLNKYGRNLQIQGVNMSVGYPFDAEWFACGQSPLCVEVNRLVRSGVVVVVAAGNTGYSWQQIDNEGTMSQSGLDLSINDPGNADLAITVGATHRESPHIYGVSYFSSKGPTGDGRPKPDLVAPGEKIVSCATGKGCEGIDAAPGAAVYVEQSGTSQAAPHVSGAVAAFLSIRREFIGRPEQVKEIFLSTATDLKRDRNFQGAGLVDMIRAIQSV